MGRGAPFVVSLRNRHAAGGSAEDSVATVRAAMEAGVTLIDTALAYTRPGVESYAEQVIAQALRGVQGEHPLIATKGGHWRDGDRFPIDGRPGPLRAHCEISLRTLGVDRIGLYQLHHVDPAVPLGASRPATITDSAASLELDAEDLADMTSGSRPV
jgi:pyridoxine 4-dehydrogenase